MKQTSGVGSCVGKNEYMGAFLMESTHHLLYK